MQTYRKSQHRSLIVAGICFLAAAMLVFVFGLKQLPRTGNWDRFQAYADAHESAWSLTHEYRDDQYVLNLFRRDGAQVNCGGVTIDEAAKCVMDEIPVVDKTKP